MKNRIVYSAAESILKLSIWTALIMGLGFIMGGAVMVYLGASGGTEIVLFKNSFTSQGA